MPRFFNTEGPCRPGRHYLLSPMGRLPEVSQLVERERYFVLHAPRQSGKTTAMIAFAEALRDRGYVALRVSLLACRGVPDVGRAEPLWLNAVEQEAAFALPEAQRPPASASASGPPGSRLGNWLADWCRGLSAPVVLLLDEADAVAGEALTSLLAQLRTGFEARGLARFPTSVAMIGLRDLRDYLGAPGDREASPGSPFNNVASLSLRNFYRAEVAELYGQHTAETGQVFAEAAIDRAHYWTDGQPYLVNALAQRCVDGLVPDRSLPVLAEHIEAARDELIRARVTHLDHLAERLHEARVARVVAPIVAGEGDVPADTDDFQYCVDLGLMKGGPPVIANPWYREVLARQLSLNREESLPELRRRWETASGELDMAALLAAFVAWWRENGDLLREGQGLYREAAPHIALMAFLQRVVNGGGRIYREYAAGRGRMDLLVEYAGGRHAIEIKRVTSDAAALRVREEGSAQLVEYLDRVGLPEGWLVIFDARPGKPWEQRLWTEERSLAGRSVHLLGAGAPLTTPPPPPATSTTRTAPPAR